MRGSESSSMGGDRCWWCALGATWSTKGSSFPSSVATCCWLPSSSRRDVWGGRATLADSPSWRNLTPWRSATRQEQHWNWHSIFMKWIWSSILCLNRLSILNSFLTASSSAYSSPSRGSTFSLKLSSLGTARLFFGDANSSPSTDTGSAIFPSAAILAISSSFKLVFNASLSSSMILFCWRRLSTSSCRPASWYCAANASCSRASTFRRCTSTSSLMSVNLFLADFSSSWVLTKALEDLNASFLALLTSFSYRAWAWVCVSLFLCDSSCNMF